MGGRAEPWGKEGIYREVLRAWRLMGQEGER